MTVRIRRYSWQLVPAAVRAIRQQVFIDEQAVPESLEWDETDDLADHFLLWAPDRTPAAVARRFPGLDGNAHIGRMAVLPQYRGLGYGKALLQHLMAECPDECSGFRLSAQQQAIGFYQSAGFHVSSDVYDDAGIPHVDMLCLAPQTLSGNDQLRSLPLVLEADEPSWLFHSDSTFCELLDSLASQATQRLWLYDQLLEHALYDRERFRDILSALARSHRLSDVRLLIHDDRPLIQRRHQLVELMRRLPSRMELRLINPGHPFEERPFALVDRSGLIVRHEFGQPEGVARFAAAGPVKRQAEIFQRMWDTATPSRELRELPL